MADALQGGVAAILLILLGAVIVLAIRGYQWEKARFKAEKQREMSVENAEKTRKQEDTS